MTTNETQTSDTTAKVDSLRFLKLIKQVHVAGNASATAVLWLFCAMANASDECYPSIDCITIRTGLSRDTVPRSIDKLVEMGLVSVLKRIHNSNVYTLNFDALLALKETCEAADRLLLDGARGKRANKQHQRRTRRSADESVAPKSGDYKNGVVAPKSEVYKDELVAPNGAVCSPQPEGVVAPNGEVCSPQIRGTND